ncbi:MAG TPA: MBL fold metallo-hydrolase [Clostridia bacterium]|nr:MBL fold metallo-hydrolase [Clostridia bacterium]
MKSWFIVEKIDELTYALSEYGHYEHTHAYLLLGMRSALLIDTGLGVNDISAVVAGLTSLPVYVTATHAHWDHIGGHALFPRFAVHDLEADWLSESFPLPLEAVKAQLLKEPCDFPPGFDVASYRLFKGAPDRVLNDLDTFDLGGRLVQVLHTPGHSPGHMCFYEHEKGYLYTGDLIYLGCLDAYYPTTDPAAFYRSVSRVAALPVSRILPGHHALSVPQDLPKRIQNAFRSISGQNKLYTGAGVFAFGDFQIHL